jgi:flagellar biosynthesis/type III secretory pathway protein FliH
MLGPGARQRVLAEELDARETARVTLERARAEAARIVEEARRGAKDQAVAAASEAREQEVARFAALALRARHDDETRAARDLDRSVALATLLAERLLGEALRLDPTVVVKLARQALAEARGARHAVIEAHPLDVDALRGHLDVADLGVASFDLRTDPSLERGSLRISTHLGTLDAQLHPRLERLAEALRDPSRHV